MQCAVCVFLPRVAGAVVLGRVSRRFSGWERVPSGIVRRLRYTLTWSTADLHPLCTKPPFPRAPMRRKREHADLS